MYTMGPDTDGDAALGCHQLLLHLLLPAYSLLSTHMVRSSSFLQQGEVC